MYWLQQIFPWTLPSPVASQSPADVLGTVTPPPTLPPTRYFHCRSQYSTVTACAIRESPNSMLRIVDYESGHISAKEFMVSVVHSWGPNNVFFRGHSEGEGYKLVEGAPGEESHKYLFTTMPTLSECQLLIQNVLLETEIDLDEYMAEGLLDDDDNMDLDHRNESDDNSDTSDTSSTSSDSSSSSSDSSGSDASMHSAISDDDEDEVYAAKMSASGELLQVILETRVLNPHKVAKASQLHLVLVEFKEGDHKTSLDCEDQVVNRLTGVNQFTD
ncbi:hypothetical protein DFH07DRAFT_943217 [Mycena maculata]|uniref:Uncharacterized protein n=1 Tax=Mycena maculata TaxID=230809 RepID=A0AAD7IIF7_9AGAR|nr:hypothetical protein DFH07DRAFT_943217 [Mycena maculata]